MVQVPAELRQRLERYGQDHVLKAWARLGEPERTAEAVSAARGGLKLWDWLLLVVLGIALFEPWLANRISARHYVKPRAAPLVTGPDGVHAQRVSERNAPQTEEVGS